MSEPELSIEKIQTLLEKSRGRDWYFQLGWGIQYWVTRETGESAVGLLVPDGHEGSATVSEMDLMAASQQIARQYVSAQSELAALRTQLDAAQARAEAAEKQAQHWKTRMNHACYRLAQQAEDYRKSGIHDGHLNYAANIVAEEYKVADALAAALAGDAGAGG